MTFAELEKVYEALAEAIDRSGPRSEMFLAKVALTLAHELGDAGLVFDTIETCLNDVADQGREQTAGG